MINEFYSEPIILSENDSVDFVNELRNPTAEYISRRNNAFSVADSEMTITDCDNGFVVDIPSLDISSLKAKKSLPVMDELSIDFDEIIAALSHVAHASEMLANSVFVSRPSAGNLNIWNTSGISTECEMSFTRNIDRKELVEGNATNLRFAA